MDYFKDWAVSCRRELEDNVMPFWLRHGWDRVNGGVYTCLDRDGSLMDSTKSGWFQGRFAFTCAYAANVLGAGEEYLAAARSTLDFIDAHLFDSRGRAYFALAADGTPLRMRRYLFSECFAAIAMSEYSKATGDKAYAQKALELLKRVRAFAGDKEMTPPKFEPSVKTQGHSLTMILINVALRLKDVCDDPVLDAQIAESVKSLRENFVHPEFKALLETVGPNGEFIDTCDGRTINPGHAIETAWFLMETSERTGDASLLELAFTVLEWSLDWGWDGEYGGILSFRDCRNLPPQCYEHDMKFWWPHCEALIACQYAHKLTGDAKWLDWHAKVRDWTYSHFPDREFGEWYGYLHRDGTVTQRAKGNLFKGPFHIPRMLLKSIELSR